MGWARLVGTIYELEDANEVFERDEVGFAKAMASERMAAEK